MNTLDDLPRPMARTADALDPTIHRNVICVQGRKLGRTLTVGRDGYWCQITEARDAAGWRDAGASRIETATAHYRDGSEEDVANAASAEPAQDRRSPVGEFPTHPNTRTWEDGVLRQISMIQSTLLARPRD